MTVKSDVDDIAQSHCDIVLVLEDHADLWRNLALGKYAGCYLVEQGLEQMVGGSVDDRDADGVTP
jgi:hypothetical protein